MDSDQPLLTNLDYEYSHLCWLDCCCDGANAR